jgi:hypothetical protein
MQDYNTYWQVATEPTASDPALDFNVYGAEAQTEQQGRTGNNGQAARNATAGVPCSPCWYHAADLNE